MGRVLFGQLLPDGLDWTEGQVDKWALEDLLDRCWHQLGSASAAELANAMMGFGFRMATRSGVSLGKDTLSQFSEYDEMLSAAWQRADEIAATGNDEQESVNHWMEVHDRMTVRALEEHAVREGGFNATHMMAVSGARGNSNQLRTRSPCAVFLSARTVPLIRCRVRPPTCGDKVRSSSWPGLKERDEVWRIAP